jgi:hypothetical protein
LEVGVVTSYNDTGLTNGVAYSYKLRAMNTVGEGAQSITVTCTPATTPSAPQNFQITTGDGQVVLTWNVSSVDGGSDITGYNIYRGITPEDLTLLISIEDVFSYTDSSVTNGQTYYYEVSAINGIGEGYRSGHVAGVPVAAPADEDNDSIIMMISLILIIAAVVVMLFVITFKKKKPEVPDSIEEEELSPPPPG